MLAAGTTRDGSARPDEREIEELVKQHLPLVRHAVTAVRNRVPRSIDADDLMSAGMLGLAQAAKSFDPARGITFGRYAKYRISGAIVDELRGRDWASRSVRADGRRLKEARERLTAATNRTPSKEETAAEMGVEVAALQRLEEDLHRAATLQLEAVLPNGAQDALVAHQQTAEEIVEHNELVEHLGDAVEHLPERLRAVVVGYFLEGRPMLEIAQELGVTDSRISQMRAEAVTMLRSALEKCLEPDAATAPPANQAASRRVAAYCAAVAEASTARIRASHLAQPGQAVARAV